MFFGCRGYLKGKPASDSDLKLYIHSLALIRASELILEPVIIDKQMGPLTIRVWVKGDREPCTVDFYPREGMP